PGCSIRWRPRPGCHCACWPGCRAPNLIPCKVRPCRTGDSQGLMAVPSVEFGRVRSGSAAADRDTDRGTGHMQNRVRAEKRLRAKDIAALPPGAHEDGGGLRLVVEPP